MSGGFHIRVLSAWPPRRAVAKLAIVGAGHVGVCTGVVFAEKGHEVTFVDVHPAKLVLLPRVVVDGRRAFDGPRLEAAGIRYRAIGLGRLRA